MSFEARRIAAAAALGAALLVPSAAGAQAWVPPEGQGSVSVLYHHLFVQDHLFSRGDRHDSGHIRTQVVTADLEYGLTDRFSLRALLPYVAAKYTGPRPHRHRGEPPHGFRFLDDSTYHSAVQDFRLEGRYGALELPLAIAPFVAVSFPTHNYEFFAHSAIGLNMSELQIGTYVGALRESFSFQGRVSHGFYERVLGHRRRRSNIDAEIGWSAGRNVRLFAFQLAQISHGVFEIPFEQLSALSAEEWWPHHDQLGRANLLNVGGGVSIRVTPSLALNGSLLTTAIGANTHAVKYGVTVGTTWAFGEPRPSHGTSVRQP